MFARRAISATMETAHAGWTCSTTEDEWKPNSITGCTLFRCFCSSEESLHTLGDISVVEVEMYVGLLSNCNDMLIERRSASRGMQRLKHNLAEDAVAAVSAGVPSVTVVAVAADVLVRRAGLSVNTTPQMTRLRDAKVCNNWLQMNSRSQNTV